MRNLTEEQLIKRRAYDKERSKTIKRRWTKLQNETKKSNRICTLTFEEFATLIKLPCHYCENLLGTTQSSSGYNLDRLDNNSGYLKENVVPCCFICNSIKGNELTEEETKAAIQAIIKERYGKF